MRKSIKNTSINFLMNFMFFILIILCIQNSKNKRSIDFFSIKTIPLPISFVIGTSFIVGSLNGGFIVNYLSEKKN